MERVISFFRTKDGKPLITKTILKATLINSSFLFFFFLLFNIFTYIELINKFIEKVDKQLEHELEHIVNSISISGNNISLINHNEFKEDDLIHYNDHSYFLQIYYDNGNVVAKSLNIDKYRSIPLKYPEFKSNYYYEDLYLGKDVLRMIIKRLYNIKGYPIGYIQMATFKTAEEIQKDIFIFNLIAFPFALILIFLASIWLSKVSFKPIYQIIALAERISTSNLKEKLKYDENNDYELERLKRTLNNLLERLDRQVNEIMSFTNNASHQLMSPLTAINSELEYILRKPRTEEEYKETLLILQEQTKHMINIIKTLLLLSRDCSECSDERSVFDIKRLVDSEISTIFKNKKVKFLIEPNLLVRGKKDYFSIVLENLIDNGLKYSANKEVIVKAYNKNKQIFLEVADQGIGIPDEEKNKIFDKFYRSNSTLQKGIKGYGLGLSLVKSITESMGGVVIIEDNKPTGTIFKINLPAISFH